MIHNRRPVGSLAVETKRRPNVVLEREEMLIQPERYGPFPYVPINRRPGITWPDGAHVALWVIPNIQTFPPNEPVPGGAGKAPADIKVDRFHRQRGSHQDGKG
jgi:hypothetical protein